MIKSASLLASGIALAGITSTSAQTTNLNAAVKGQPTPSAGLVNDWLREQSPEFSKWDIGGQFRLRLEHKEHFATPGLGPTAVDFRRAGGNSDNTYLLLREKLHVGYKPIDWLGAYVEARDSSSHGDERNPNPEADTFDLHQGYLTLGNAKEFPLTAKVGRQELSYGDERLIGAFDWNNIGRVFDAAKLRAENDLGWIDAFVGRVVIPRDDHWNESNDYDYFSGLYASSKKLVPNQETEVYFLARNVGEQSPATIGAGLPAIWTGASPRNIYTFGFRVKSLPGAYGGWDYSAEVAGQLGDFQFAAGGRELDHEAFAAHVGGGYTFKDTWATPRVGLEYNYASGDEDPTDGDHTTFENLFPTNHKFYGYMDFVSWQNIHNPRLTASIKPLKKLTVTADYHAFWLAETSDFFYQVNGAPRSTGGYGINAGADNYVGSEVDLVATYAFKPYAALQVGYGHFFVGDYIKDTLGPVGGAKDADYLYSQFVFTF